MSIQIILIIFGAVVGFLISLLRTKLVANKSIATINALTNSISQKKIDETAAKASSDAAVKDYLDALKKYDSDFHDDDDTGGHSA